MFIKTTGSCEFIYCKSFDNVLLDDITFLDISGNKAVTTIPFLRNLQILRGERSGITRFPIFGASIRNINLSYTPIEKIPHLDHLTELEQLDLTATNVSCVEELRLPNSMKVIDFSYSVLQSFSLWNCPELVSLNLSYNYLLEVDPSLRQLPSGIANFHQNSFNWSFVKPTTSSSSSSPLVNRITEHQRNAGSIEGENNLNNPHHVAHITLPKIEENIFYNNSQNVHLPSIQKSTNKSLEFLINFGPIQEGYVFKLEKLFTHKINTRRKSRFFLFNWYFKYKKQTDLVLVLLQKSLKEGTLHSEHGLSLYELLGYIYNVIENQKTEQQLEIVQVLKQELLAGEYMCFTGRFTRILNSLCGFIPEINIQISAREEMQAEISALLARNRTKYPIDDEYIFETKKEMKGILEKFNVTELEKESWLLAVTV